MTISGLEISNDLLELEKELDGLIGDEQEAAIAEWFEKLCDADMDQFMAMLDNYGALIQELSARAEIRKAEAARLSARAKTDTLKVKALKTKLMTFFQEGDLKFFDTPRFSMQVARNGGVPPLTIDEDFDLDNVPAKFIKREINRAEVRQALNIGIVLPFAKFEERGYSMRIN